MGASEVARRIITGWDQLQQTLKHRDLERYVDEHLRQVRKKPPLTPDDTINASQILNFCPRAEAIRVEYDVEEVDTFDAKTIRIFEVGRQFETFLRDRVLGKMGISLGRWRCIACGHVPEQINGHPRYARPEECPLCKSLVFKHAQVNAAQFKGLRHKPPERFSYVEEWVRDEGSKVGGFIDGFVYFNTRFFILEAKTVNANRFRQVKKSGPFPDHIAQIQIYLKHTRFEDGILWYYNKDNGAELLFYVKHDFEFSRKMNNKGYHLQNYFQDRTMPYKICSSPTCARAKKCPVVSQCFSEQCFSSQSRYWRQKPS